MAAAWKSTRSRTGYYLPTNLTGYLAELNRAMIKLFDNLMTGLDEVDAFLAGETAGCRVNFPEEFDARNVAVEPAEEVRQDAEITDGKAGPSPPITRT